MSAVCVVGVSVAWRGAGLHSARKGRALLGLDLALRAFSRSRIRSTFHWPGLPTRTRTTALGALCVCASAVCVVGVGVGVPWRGAGLHSARKGRALLGLDLALRAFSRSRNRSTFHWPGLPTRTRTTALGALCVCASAVYVVGVGVPWRGAGLHSASERSCVVGA